MVGIVTNSFEPAFDTGRVPKGYPGAGQFTRGYAPARTADEALNRIQSQFNRYATTMADDVAAYYDDHRRRSGATGRLQRATLDPRNRIVTRTSLDVGIPDFLDNSVAKYWRTIEEGSAVTMPTNWLGRKIYGAFAEGGGFNRPMPGKVGAGTGQFFPGKRTADGQHSEVMLRRGMPGGFGWGSGRGIIQTHIRAQDAYGKIYRRMGGSETLRQIVDDAIFGG